MRFNILTNSSNSSNVLLLKLRKIAVCELYGNAAKVLEPKYEITARGLCSHVCAVPLCGWPVVLCGAGCKDVFQNERKCKTKDHHRNARRVFVAARDHLHEISAQHSAKYEQEIRIAQTQQVGESNENVRLPLVVVAEVPQNVCYVEYSVETDVYNTQRCQLCLDR